MNRCNGEGEGYFFLPDLALTAFCESRLRSVSVSDAIRALPALRAISVRCSLVSFLARAGPPLRPPRRPRALAAADTLGDGLLGGFSWFDTLTLCHRSNIVATARTGPTDTGIEKAAQ